MCDAVGGGEAVGRQVHAKRKEQSDRCSHSREWGGKDERQIDVVSGLGRKVGRERVGEGNGVGQGKTAREERVVCRPSSTEI